MRILRKLKSRERLNETWESIHTSFWFLPALLTSFSVALAAVSLELDQRLISGWSRDSFFLFGGSSDAARDLLSAIAGSVITVVSVAFSITIVAIQQASTQYSPRILKRFTKDRGNQLVLGAYVATFVYALLILRDVRSSSDGAAADRFIPALSITVALVFTVISVGLLVYFIHHITRQIQVSSMLSGIREEINHEILRLYPQPLKKGAREAHSYAEEVKRSEIHQIGKETVIAAPSDGYLRVIQIEKLIEFTKECRFVWVLRLPGEFIAKGAPILRIWADDHLDEAKRSTILDQVSISTERNIRQDLLFGIRQMADVAVKALSPGVNDPATADQCVSELKGMLSLLMKQEIPPAKTNHGETVFLVNRPDFSDYVEKCFGQIRRNSAGSFESLMFFLDALDDLIALAPSEERRKALSDQAVRVQNLLKGAERLPPDDLEALRKRTTEVLERSGLGDQSPGRQVA